MERRQVILLYVKICHILHEYLEPFPFMNFSKLFEFLIWHAKVHFPVKNPCVAISSHYFAISTGLLALSERDGPKIFDFYPNTIFYFKGAYTNRRNIN
jgi:hypothetical protein